MIAKLILKTVGKRSKTYQEIIDNVRSKTKIYNSQSIERRVRYMVDDGILVRERKTVTFKVGNKEVKKTFAAFKIKGEN